MEVLDSGILKGKDVENGIDLKCTFDIKRDTKKDS